MPPRRDPPRPPPPSAANPQIGTLEPGKKSHLAIWNIERPAELVYRIGFNPLHQRIWNSAS